MRADIYQTVLIFLLVVAAVLGGVFVYNEIYPEYKIFQEDYVELEKFRSSYTGEAPPEFKIAVKQIVIARSDKGPETIDRCTSCHVALEFPHFSPTKIAYDVNGNIVVDREGNPVKIANEDYIWKRLDDRISVLTEAKFNQKLIDEGKQSTVNSRLAKAAELTALKTKEVDGQVVDMTKVLAMHPLMGRETHPFEFHPMDQYGCTSCHNGNGRGLVMDKAHGPVYDGQYHPEFEGEKLHFLETDPYNDPKFAYAYNNKPNYELLFQTTPLFVGGMIEAKCIQCHQPTNRAFQNVLNEVSTLTGKKNLQVAVIKKGIIDDEKSLQTLLSIKEKIESIGLIKLLNQLEKNSVDYTLSSEDLKAATSQIRYIKDAVGFTQIKKENESTDQKMVITKMDHDIGLIAGSDQVAQQIATMIKGKKLNEQTADEQIALLMKFYEEHQDIKTGSLFEKAVNLNLAESLIQHVQQSENSFHDVVKDREAISAMTTDVDALLKTYHKGEGLYITQACYACHRIAGFSRGGVGPELTNEGKAYPWFVKKKISWPQGDLPSSTMPNMVLDHEEIEALMSFVLSQNNDTKAISAIQYQTNIKEWESGRKTAIEEPLPPNKIHDLRNSMMIFATEGCASCHRLKGFESNVGYAIEKSETAKEDGDAPYRESQWFSSLFPETVIGSQIVQMIEKYGDQIDKRIASDVRKDSILEEIDKKDPDLLEALDSNFKYAIRARNHEYQEKANAEKDPKKRAEILQELADWKAKVKKVMMLYYQEYGFGRLIGPRLNWSGLFRTDDWLMEHFHNPTSTSPKSLMPSFPFDDSKFYALTYMLDTLAVKNRNQEQQLWDHRGFNPSVAFEIYCSQCHGDHRHGNGPVATWIYPLPKNLTNAAFLHNLTKDQATLSIHHGVKGTPMPPWGEVAQGKLEQTKNPVLSEQQIGQLVDWLYNNLPEEGLQEGRKDVMKWEYSPRDVIEEMRKEGDKLKSGATGKEKDTTDKANKPQKINLSYSDEIDLFEFMATGDGYYAALTPTVTRNNSEVEEYFDEKPPLYSGGEPQYYIKKEYYTQQNLDNGQQLFEMNCSICHGKDADGTGLRAATMTEAKPRMLININWSENHDDLRLLRSIKYGVPGTAMTPWGDLTTSLQRMQLVMFIRSLSAQAKLTNDLTNAINNAFGSSLEAIDFARSKEYQALDQIENQIKALKKQESLSDKEAVAAFEKKLELKKALEAREKIDHQFVELRKSIIRESSLFEEVGKELITRDLTDQDYDQLFDLIKMLQSPFSLQDYQLVYKNDESQKKKVKQLEEKLLKKISGALDQLNQEKVNLAGKIPSVQVNAELQKVDTDIKAFNKLKEKMISNFSEADKLEQEQQMIYSEIKQDRQDQLRRQDKKET